MVIAVDILLKQRGLRCLFGHCGPCAASDRRAQKRTETDINSRCESFLLFMLQQNAVLLNILPVSLSTLTFFPAPHYSLLKTLRWDFYFSLKAAMANCC